MVRLKGSENEEYEAKAVILAMGAEPRKLGLERKMISEDGAYPIVQPVTELFIRIRM